MAFKLWKSKFLIIWKTRKNLARKGPRGSDMSGPYLAQRLHRDLVSQVTSVSWPLVTESSGKSLDFLGIGWTESLGSAHVLGQDPSSTRACCARVTLSRLCLSLVALGQRVAFVPFPGFLLGHYRVICSKIAKWLGHVRVIPSGMNPNSGFMSRQT